MKEYGSNSLHQGQSSRQNEKSNNDMMGIFIILDLLNCRELLGMHDGNPVEQVVSLMIHRA